MKVLNCCWNSVYRKLFNYNKWESVKHLIHLLGRLDIHRIINILFIAYIKRLASTDNDVMNYMYDNCGRNDRYGTRSASPVPRPGEGGILQHGHEVRVTGWSVGTDPLWVAHLAPVRAGNCGAGLDILSRTLYADVIIIIILGCISRTKITLDEFEI